ncbi:sigma-54-dependent Fis family transcriptional regulator [Bergeyella porcorum]|uniref:Sigma-54-dependent Fis family transcriptional regulator n=1 Tax=Bergeyella porcorum TaxID=1735111 RepID=A0AAU0F1G9_9FLAO
MPPLRERKRDIHLLFRKFAIDFAEKYRMPELRLTDDAVQYLEQYPFPGNIRQLRNLVEQMTVVEQNREVNAVRLSEYIPMEAQLPAVVQKGGGTSGSDFNSEREIMYKILFDMRNDINDLKSLTLELIKNRGNAEFSSSEKGLINRIYATENQVSNPNSLLYFENPAAGNVVNPTIISQPNEEDFEDIEEIEVEETKPETLSLQNNEKELIIKALEKHKGRRNKAADELGISQRTLYRKI